MLLMHSKILDYLHDGEDPFHLEDPLEINNLKPKCCITIVAGNSKHEKNSFAGFLAWIHLSSSLDGREPQQASPKRDFGDPLGKGVLFAASE
jgi:hypothetical protein